MKRRKIILIILDGWGIAQNPEVSAIDQANTPFFDYIIRQYPSLQLNTSGLQVGLPEGQMGNSEVGHMNIGAGRIVYQDLVRINQEVASKQIQQNIVFQNIISYCITHQKPLHLMGLLSNGGVHSNIKHLTGIIPLLIEAGVPQVFIHCFMDGRDTGPTTGISFLQELSDAIEPYDNAQIASLIGRYYAMDRDKRWERIRKAYDLITKGMGTPSDSPIEAVKQSYAQGITDEFIEPIVVTQKGQAVATLKEGDAVLFFNFRTDRGRQLTHVLTQEDMPTFGMQTLPLHYTTMTRYDKTFEGINVLYEKQQIQNSIGEVLEQHNRKQIRIAETEKYPHVTFFLNGGREKPFHGEQRIICPSPQVATYDLKPEMSAHDIKDNIIAEINKGEADFICLNFANPDMVGHTGVFDAAVKACEIVDQCAKDVTNAALQNGYTAIITADHGNADQMKNPDGSPHTAHTTVPVPCVFVNNSETFKLKAIGKLGDLAPTILSLLGLPIPQEMTGEILIIPPHKD